MEELFKTVKFGGYDKEEVLEFINNKFEQYEKNEEKNHTTILENKLEIETLKNKLLDYEEKLASTLVENQRLVDVITHQETQLVQEYSQSQIVSTLVTAKNVSEKIINDANLKAEGLMRIAKSDAYQKIKFKTDSNKILEDYEIRFKTLMKNIHTLSEISSDLLSTVKSIDDSLKEMSQNLPIEIRENE